MVAANGRAPAVMNDDAALIDEASKDSTQAPNLPARVEQPAPELSIVVPTFNEQNNVHALVHELSTTLAGIAWEVIFVDDDSPDGTAQVVRSLARKHSYVRCVQRIGRRGLSSACIEGMLGSSAPYLAVMDGDLQHDPSIIPAMFKLLKSTNSEIVVGSRYTEGGATTGLDRVRLAFSRIATHLGHTVLPESLKDPMSGFFMLRRTLLEEVVHQLSGLGFKILLDVFASARRPIAFREVPFEFRPRYSGESKLDTEVAWEYLMLLADKLIGRYVPVRFVAFAGIGGLGVGVHLLILSALYRLGRVDFVSAQAISTLITMLFNYFLNNVLTYRDKRRRGVRWLTGLASFVAVCSVGAIANVGVAAYLFNRQSEWLLAAVAGVLVGAVWNYSVSSVYTWGRPKQG
jgi:dolichol-phosphate mannosyltransferase